MEKRRHTRQRSMDATDVASVRARILARVTRDDNGCLLWDVPNRDGYGEMNYRGRVQGAHVMSYLAWRGDIPEDHHIDHLCCAPLCVEPAHLEAVTQAENNRRMSLRGRNGMTRKTACPRGHEYTAENTRYAKNASGTLSRKCRQCRRSDHPQVFHRGEDNPQAKLTRESVIKIREMRAHGMSMRKIAGEVGVSDSVINSVLKRRTWAHIA